MSITSLLLTAVSIFGPLGGVALDCQSSPGEPSRIAMIIVDYEDHPSHENVNVDVRVKPMIGFADPSLKRIENVQRTRLTGFSNRSEQTEIHRISSIDGTQNHSSHWRVDMTIPQSFTDTDKVTVTLQNTQADQVERFEMSCSIRIAEGAD